jgi:hypothetical protein
MAEGKNLPTYFLDNMDKNHDGVPDYRAFNLGNAAPPTGSNPIAVDNTGMIRVAQPNPKRKRLIFQNMSATQNVFIKLGSKGNADGSDSSVLLAPITTPSAARWESYDWGGEVWACASAAGGLLCVTETV